jgi:phosphate transport system protein
LPESSFSDEILSERCVTVVFELFKGRGESQVDSIEAGIGEMLSTVKETLGMAIGALLREVLPEEVRRPLRKRDKAINRVERTIRRQLVVHAGVQGAQADLPLLFVYMSISKDIERVGDIAKDLWDIADAGADFSRAADREEVVGYARKLEDLVEKTAVVFADRDEETAIRVLNETDELKDFFERLMLSQLDSGEPASEAAARALLYRHFQRIAAHLMNVMTAVVMPFDRLDYWDEKRVDRE